MSAESEQNKRIVERLKLLNNQDPRERLSNDQNSREAQAQLSLQKDVAVSPDEPTLTFAGMMWMDTSGPEVVMKERNKTNDGWITIQSGMTLLSGPNDPT